MMRKIKCLCAAFVLVFLVSCAKKNYVQSQNYSFKSGDGAPDYSALDYWAAHPWKWDPSDSVPLPLKNSIYRDSLVDVFFVHPTSFTDDAATGWNAELEDAELNRKTDYSSILYQASVFNEQCRVFAPRYRQAHMRAFITIDTENKRKAFDLAYEDVKRSFEFYLEHWNGARPIIIASHSQGTVHAARLLKDYFENKTLRNRLVCAYLVGMPVPENYLSSIPACRDSLATGCLLSWRTYKRNYVEPYIRNENYMSVVNNPLNWQYQDSSIAPRSMNTGAVLRNFNKVKSGVVDAQIHGNVLWTCKPKFPGSILIRKKNYHIGDYNLFYVNIRNNVRTRINMFWKR
jgi:hypothetical protein